MSRTPSSSNLAAPTARSASHPRRGAASRDRRRCFPLAGAATLIVAVVVGLSPEVASADTPSSSACGSLYHGDPPGSLRLATSPEADTVLHSGQTVRITATWNTGDWSRAELHKVLHCVLLDGEVAYDLSRQEKPTANDGTFTYAFTVPANARRICDRARLSARPAPGEDLVVQKSNVVCFAVVDADAVIAPAPPVTQVAEPVIEPAAVTVIGDDLVAAPSEPPPAAPAADPALVTLPRTGGNVFTLVGVAAVCLLIGAGILGTRRLGTDS